MLWKKSIFVVSPSSLLDICRNYAIIVLNNTTIVSADELPSFSIRSLSPGGRSISPIDIEDLLLDLDVPPRLADRDENELDAEIYFQPISLVSFSEIDAKITPLKAKNLETIFEDVFLETPPRSGGRTVIPRRSYEQQGDEEEEATDDDDEDALPLCESFEAILTTFEENCTAGMDAEDSATLTSFCNSFKRRLNLIPGEEED